MPRRGIVTFLSDYGLEDEFVGVCHGVMLLINPDIRIVDIHHQILRQNIRHGAIVLSQSIPYMADAVHLAVVDPAEMGPSLGAQELVPLEVPKAWTHDDHLHAEVLQLDRFGNLQLNLSKDFLAEVGLSDGEQFEVRLEGHRITVPFGRTFND